MTDEEIFEVAKRAIKTARSKHPDWPDDPIHASAIVSEEAGELTAAALQANYEGGKIEQCRIEALHVIATAVRFLSETPL